MRCQYPFILETTIPTSTSVSQIKQMENEQEEKEISFAKPKFLKQEEKITGAQKGTLVHLCMQKLNIKKEYDLQGIKDLINNLVEKELITKNESLAINPYTILEFTKSEIWKELKEAEEVQREKTFYINIPAKEIYGGETEEVILVQGIIDLYYKDKNGEYVLVDYKTDYVEKGQELELIKKYKKQLEIYKQALEEALGTKINRVYIYSTRLGILKV